MIKLEGFNMAVPEDGITEGVGVKHLANKCYKQIRKVKQNLHTHTTYCDGKDTRNR